MAAHRLLSWGMHVRSSSLTWDWTRVPYMWEHGVLSTAPPGKSLFVNFLIFYFFLMIFLSAYILFMYVCMYVCMYVWLCWVFVSVRGLPPVVASGGQSSSRCAGLSLSRPLPLRSTGSRRAGPAIVAHGPSCSAACGIFPDQGSNPCPLHWQADS